MAKHVYFLGIGGTLMGSLAQLARDMGHTVSGSDKALYPPMSDQLANADVTVYEGFDPAQLDPAPDLVVVGNAGLPRGHPGIEYVLEQGLPYTSGAEFLGREILAGRWVLGVSGTHGKTTTASMLAWILDRAGLEPGYLIGGVPKNFETSARLGTGPFFVVEADEYDTSYFDRRSKFVHYRPRTLVINNLEYDHADIFVDLAAIQTQFHHLIRTVPGGGLIVAPGSDDHVQEVLQMGCWTPTARFGPPSTRAPLPMDNGDAWTASEGDGSEFDVLLGSEKLGRVRWNQLGEHNVHNALAAIAAARHAGVRPADAIAALCDFSGVLRRMDLIAEIGSISVYDDFAHHPTAIRKTLQGLRNKVGSEEIVAIVEPRSHTMSLGTLRDELITCCSAADSVYWFRGENIRWDLAEVVQACVVPARQFDDLDKLMDAVARLPQRRRHIVIMSNGSFGNIYRKLPERLRAAEAAEKAVG
ncbi:MAG: UDP-N-acetylmuramate:L-alanyl-gamma-D-glutamyl-meso-diaminopimelate ligase [Pseudomonadales bacterium]